MLIRFGRKTCVLGAILALYVLPAAAAIDVPGRWVRFEWTPASGPVLGYMVYTEFNAQPEILYLATSEAFVTVFGPPGTTVTVRVVPFDSDVREGPSSQTSDLVRLVEDGAPPGGGDPPGGEDPPPPDDPPGGEDPPPDDPGDDPVPPAELPFAPQDFDGNGTADLPIRSRSDGIFRVIGVLGLDGSRNVGEMLSAHIPADLDLVGMADHDGDGTADTLWTEPDGGPLQLGLTRLGGALQTVDIAPTARVVGSGDFDGDGRGDIVVTDDGAESLELWLMDGAERLEGVHLSRWRGPRDIVASADVDGDGLVELVVYNRMLGWLSVWHLDGGRLEERVAFDASDLGEGWRVIGAGDTDGDGLAELLWLDPADGGMHVWRFLPDGGTDLQRLAVPSWGSPRPVAMGDFDADGRSELLMRDATGAVTVWFLDGADVVDQQSVLRLVLSWDVEAVGSENPQLQ